MAQDPERAAFYAARSKRWLEFVTARRELRRIKHEAEGVKQAQGALPPNVRSLLEWIERLDG